MEILSGPSDSKFGGRKTILNRRQQSLIALWKNGAGNVTAY